MSKVCVRWYGKVLEGELLDGDYLGMKQIVIPLDGHRPTALFTPEHVYDSIEQIPEKSSINKPKAEVIAQKPQEISPKQQEVSSNRAKDLSAIEAFKRENWDTERGHLRIDKLDEFYKLWRMVMRPSGYVEAEAPITLLLHKEEPVIAEAPKRIVSDERMEELKQQLKTKLDPNPSRAKPSKKMLRSTGQQQFNNATQLSLFEL